MSSKVCFSEQLDRQLEKMMRDLVYENVQKLAEVYKFNAEEAVGFLDLGNIEIVRVRKQSEKPSKETKKPAFPLPYSGELLENCCHGLSKNSGLYTQCVGVPVDGTLCKKCKVSADKNDGVPEFGTIEMRQAVDLFEYKDPQGKKPEAYAKVMKKLNLTEEQVLEEAGKYNIIVNPLHFAFPSETGKKGRPTKEKVEKTGGATKGRPKKTQKVVEIADNIEEDLFQTLVENVHTEASNKKENAKKAAEVLLADVEPITDTPTKAKEAKEPKAKEAKEAKATVESINKKENAKKATEALLVGVEPITDTPTKVSSPKAKEAKEPKAKEAKATKEPKAKATKEPTKEKEPEEDVMVQFKYNDVDYFRSKKSGIVYDYAEYIKDYSVVVGEWDPATKTVKFTKEHEESDEESEDEDEEMVKSFLASRKQQSAAAVANKSEEESDAEESEEESEDEYDD